MHDPLASDQPLQSWWPDVAALFKYRDKAAAYRAARSGRIPLEFLPGPNDTLLVRTFELRRLLLGDPEPAREAV